MNKNTPLHIYITFSSAIFLGAFLLFQIQPIISKYILPWFGGASAVWTTAMLFFQTLLLLGYFYVFLISKLSLKKQITLHTALLIVAISSIIYPLYNYQTPILPNINSKLTGISPVIQILIVLFTSIGLTYFILSTTSILLQKWFAFTRPGKSPYIFYSLSNTASLLALISYPFLIEPSIQLKMQGLIWSAGFIIYSSFLLICCLQIFISISKSKQKSLKTKNIPLNKSQIRKNILSLWILLPAISSLMLLITTNLLTQSVAPVPFLWLLPLTIYLVSFIICFSGKKWYFRNLYAYVSLIAGYLSLTFIFINIPSLVIGIIIYGLLLLSICMLCHGELYDLRPKSEHLDIYYLFIALGSGISAIFVGLIAPLFFKGIWETYIGFYLTFLLTIWVFIHYKNSVFYKYLRRLAGSDKELYIVSLIIYPVVIIATAIIFNILFESNPFTVKTWRNFYGVLSVKQKTSNNTPMISLQYGNVVHGIQLLGKLQQEPTSYYTKKSGVVLAILNHPKYKKNINIGIIGLGTGTLAAYGKKGDTITFYEINPLVYEVAKTEFTYLKNSKAKINVIMGDGRLSLEKEIKRDQKRYDLLIIDAFSDDSIPLHLLTKESFAIYLKRITPDRGVLIIHTSNQYIDIKPVIVQAAKYYKLNYAFIFNKKSHFPGSYASEWALLSYDKNFLEIPAIAQAKYADSQKYKKITLWSDNYSNLFQVLK